MKTFIKPFIMLRQLLNKHFAGYNMGVVMIVLQEKERGDPIRRIMPNTVSNELQDEVQISFARYI